MFKRSMEAALHAIIVIDQTGTVFEFNPAAEEIFGFGRDDAVGREMADLIVPESLREAHRKGMQTFLKTGEGPVLGKKIEVPGLKSDGDEILLELAIMEASGDRGPIFIGYARDITDEKASQQALVEAKEKAEVATQAKANSWR